MIANRRKVTMKTYRVEKGCIIDSDNTFIPLDEACRLLNGGDDNIRAAMMEYHNWLHEENNLGEDVVMGPLSIDRFLQERES